MYGNFIYFILVLLIYATYIPPERPYLDPFETVVSFFGLLVVFFVTTRRVFYGLSKKIDRRGPQGLHGAFDRLFTRQAILALVMFTLHVYILNLKLFVLQLPVISAIPTLAALLFIALFALHLAIIWTAGYDTYRRLFQTRISRRSYVFSNILFHLPVILPWVAISAVIDLVNALPFEMPRQLLARPEGQLIFFSLFLVALIIVAPSLMRVFWRCEPLPAGPKRQRIEGMCAMAGLGYHNILTWPIFEGRLLTAGVMGLVKRFRYILVTRGLLEILNDSELEAVIAHEIGHIKKKHLLFYLVFLIGFIILSYAVFDLLIYAILYSNLSFSLPRSAETVLSHTTSLLFAAAMATILLIYFRFVFGYFMRNCERQADLYAFTLTGDGSALRSSLEKIAIHSGQSQDRPSWHHFSIRQRIDFLKKCEADSRWIERHDKKLRNSIAVFVAGLCCVGYLGYSINFGRMGNTLNSRFLEKVLVKEIQQHPENAKLYTLLGSVSYEREEYEKAIAAYEKSIALLPDNPEALNNLAWLFATCPKTRLRNPAKALFLAKKAAALNPEPHILDTLAESYYVNGKRTDAIRTIKRILEKDPPERPYYESQLRRFACGG
ncbi:MAG: M48 family metalloprotease [Deltaproteobacteria bacterium]|nr:M48 family metalloprotease [Deltaproteobacteria bacterium]